MTLVKSSPYHTQSNGKIEHWFNALKGEGIRTMTPLSAEAAWRLVAEFVSDYKTVGLHSAIVYTTPESDLAGRAQTIGTARREKPAQADARWRAKAKEKEFARSGSAELS
jgi:transposase InsO family protein